MQLITELVSPYPSKANIVTLPLQPVLPKKIALAVASFFASERTLLTFSLNLYSSGGYALNAWTVRRAESASFAT
jgi:hypothetical protein